MLLIVFFFSLISVLFCLNRFWVLWMRYTAVGRASYDGFFCQLRSEWRKNLQKIHFKPPNQARRPTFASKKTKPVMAGSTRRRQQICRLEREGRRAGDKKEKYSYKGRIRPGQREQWPAEANIGGTFSALHRAGVPTARRKAEDVTVCP